MINFINIILLKNVELKNKIFKNIWFHWDYIVEFERNKFTLLGKYNLCKCEILIYKMEKIFLIQGHSEYNPDFVINRFAPIFIKMRWKY